jgi:hypothetical protein
MEVEVTTLLPRIAARLPRDQRKERRVLKVAIVTAPVSLLTAAIGVESSFLRVVGPVMSLVITIAVLAYVRRLPRLMLAGLIGGGATGLVTLGVGSRLAMRIVSLLGARREVTVDGTVFLLIFGAVVGAMIGMTIAATLRAWPRSTRIVSIIVTLVLFAGLLLDSESFSELLHDGAGGWLNFPMFFAFVAAYGWAAPRIITRVERRIPRWAPVNVEIPSPVAR